MNPEWMTDALCIDLYPTFDADGGSGADLVNHAAALCARCPVLDDCRVYADRVAPVCGVWAGRLYRDARYVDLLSVKP